MDQGASFSLLLPWESEARASWYATRTTQNIVLPYGEKFLRDKIFADGFSNDNSRIKFLRMPATEESRVRTRQPSEVHWKYALDDDGYERISRIQRHLGSSNRRGTCLQEGGRQRTRSILCSSYRPARSTVRHVPREISTVCSLFLNHQGTISCGIIGRRKYPRTWRS